MASQWYDSTAIASLQAVANKLNGGSIKIYTGAQPSLNGAPAGTLLVTLGFSATAFAAPTASAGTVTAVANAISAGTAAASGTAGYCVLLDSSSAVVATGTVGTSGADLNLSNLSIVAGANVSCSAFSLSQTQAGS